MFKRLRANKDIKRATQAARQDINSEPFPEPVTLEEALRAIEKGKNK